MNLNFTRVLLVGAGILCAPVFLFTFTEIYIPHSLSQKPTIEYNVQKGMGTSDIAKDLEKQGIIKSSWFFKAYVALSGRRSKLQAGIYDVSSSMSIAQIIEKLASGDVIKNNITLIEGWDLQDIGQYLEDKGLSSRKDFVSLAKQDFSASFDFLKDKPKKMNLEGYIFPDTYEWYQAEKPEEMLQTILLHFGKELTPELRKAIAAQHKSIFQIVTMASVIEKEVQTPEDKKMVSGILWKRLDNNVPLQADSTVNYITGKNDPGAKIIDTKIDSPYNTYKYIGLPKGPICNPGLDSILAAIYPQKSQYWYYLSASKTGRTIFSKTLEEHNAAAAKYLR